jgi:hypothetical protein
MTVKEIITNYLKENGYDGLYDYMCGCTINGLGDCDNYCLSCVPAYLYELDRSLGVKCDGCQHQCSVETYGTVLARSNKIDCLALKRAPIGEINE